MRIDRKPADRTDKSDFDRRAEMTESKALDSAPVTDDGVAAQGLMGIKDDFSAVIGDEVSVGPTAPDWAGDPDPPVADDAPPPPPERLDIPDPELRVKHQDKYEYQKFDGPLFIDGVSYADVVQGAIADCYLVGSMAAVAHSDPETIENMIKLNDDGSYTVTFQERVAGRFEPVEITVDGDLPVKSSGSPLYAKSPETEDGKMEMWVSILEKAYAEWKGGFDDMGEGGNISKALESMTGRSSRYTGSAYVDDSRMFYRLRAAVDRGNPIAAITFGEEDADLYKEVEIHAWHTYSVHGVEESDGERYVILRNPWGSSEPGDDGKDDGVFRLAISDFRKYYQGVVINSG